MKKEVATKVELLEGGNTFKQGDEITLVFQIREHDKSIMDLTNATVEVLLSDGKYVVLEKMARVEENKIYVDFTEEDGITGHGQMLMEFQITQGEIIRKFPSDGFQEIRITPTLDDIEFGGVPYLTFEMFVKEYEQIVADTKAEVNVSVNALKKDVESRKINAMFPPAPLQGIVGNNDPNDNAKLQAILNNYRNVLVPVNDFVITETLILQPLTTLELEGNPIRYAEGAGKVARLKLSANVPAIKMEHGCIVKGGQIDVIHPNYSSSAVLVDYSTGTKNDIVIDTSIRGYSTTGSRGVLLTGNGDGGTCENLEVRGNIVNFDIGVKSEHLGGTCWATAMEVNASIITCKQAIVLLNGAGGDGGKFSGSYQPRLGTKTNLPLVEMHGIDAPYFDLKIWDMATAINNYAIALYNCTQWDIPDTVKPDLVLIKSPRNTNLRNPIIPPRGRTTYFDTISGNEENILFGAHKKFTVNFIKSSAVGITEDNGTYEKFGMFKLEQKPTYMNLGTSSANSEEWVGVTIDFDTPRNVTLLGFNPVSDPIPRPKSYRIYTKNSTDADYVLRKQANTGEEIASSGGYPETALFAKVDPYYGKNTVSVKFEFLLEKGNYAIIDSLWAKGSGSAESYLPAHGGKLYGSIELKKGNLILNNETPATDVNNALYVDANENKLKFKKSNGDVVYIEPKHKVDYGTEPPTTGKWNKLDQRLNTELFAGGYLGWVCVTSGEFGTSTEPEFRPFGLISE